MTGLLSVMAAVAGVAVLAIVGSVALGQTVGSLGVLVFLVPAAVAFLVCFVVAVAIFVAALSFSYKALAGPEGPVGAFE